MKGRWYHALPDGRVQCDLCPRHCRLRVGQRGFCFVREGRTEVGAEPGTPPATHVELTTWGRSSGFALDPIEKKPLNHFHPGTPVLSFGTAGCNLGCKFCQNWEISTARDTDRLAAPATPTRIARWCQRNDVPQVAFTYNDPIVFAEYAIDTALACHDAGLRTVAVTAGWITPQARADFFDVMDAANIDLKAFDPDFYRRITGARLEDVLDTISWVVNRGRTWVELTTLLIPGMNDDEEQLRRQYRWILAECGPDVPLHLSAFRPAHRMRDHSRTPPSAIRKAREIALAEGLHFVYSGNIHDPAGDTTTCATCGTTLIRRDWYRILDYRLTPEGTCPTCSTPVPGRFGARAGEHGPGSWRVRI